MWKRSGLGGHFCFAYLEVKDTKYRMLTDRFEFSTQKLCKNKREKKYRPKCNAMFHISTLDKYTYFLKGLQYSFI